MKKHWLYLRYLIRHKWFVWQAGRMLGVNWFQLMIHDWSKFLPSEWFPYVNYFYGNYPSEMEHEESYGGQKFFIHPEKKTREYWERRFNVAWNFHQKRNPHHYQFWILTNDDGSIKALEMPKKYVLEMVADWSGAGRAITGTWDFLTWYQKTKSQKNLHPESRQLAVEQMTVLHVLINRSNG